MCLGGDSKSRQADSEDPPHCPFSGLSCPEPSECCHWFCPLLPGSSCPEVSLYQPTRSTSLRERNTLPLLAHHSSFDSQASCSRRLIHYFPDSSPMDKNFSSQTGADSPGEGKELQLSVDLPGVAQEAQGSTAVRLIGPSCQWEISCI